MPQKTPLYINQDQTDHSSVEFSKFSLIKCCNSSFLLCLDWENQSSTKWLGEKKNANTNTNFNINMNTYTG